MSTTATKKESKVSTQHKLADRLAKSQLLSDPEYSNLLARRKANNREIQLSRIRSTKSQSAIKTLQRDLAKHRGHRNAAQKAEKVHEALNVEIDGLIAKMEQQKIAALLNTQK